MLTLRSLLFWLLYFLYVLLLFIPVLCTALLLPLVRLNFFAYLARGVLYMIKKIIGLDYEAAGTENIPPGPVIICAKHQSAYEPLVLIKLMPSQVFIIKKELLYIPLFGRALRIMYYIPINRNIKKEDTFKNLKAAVKKRQDMGFSVTIFPEGTRVPPGKIGTYKFGAAKLARELKMDIIPVATNSGEYWSKSPVKHPGKAKLCIGKPISWHNGSAAEITRTLEQEIEGMQRLIEGEGPCRPPQNGCRQG